METKPYSEMTPTERSVVEAEVARREAARPEAIEAEPVQMFQPGVIFFSNDRYCAVSPDIETVWPRIERYLEILLSMLPAKYRLDYWRERIECGATLALAFTETADSESIFVNAGIMNCELADDGKRIVGVMIPAFDPVDLEHPARIAECAALATGAQQVIIWTPAAVPIVAGYRVENCWFGQLQVIDIEPIQ